MKKAKPNEKPAPIRISKSRSRKNELLVTWKSHYKLIDLCGHGRNNLELPGKIGYPEFEKLEGHRDLIVFADRGGGGKTFLDWWRRNIDGAGSKYHWLMINGNTLESDLIEGSDRVVNKSEDSDGAANESVSEKQSLDPIRKILEPKGETGSVGEFFDAFTRISKKLEKEKIKLFLIFYNPSAMGEQARNLVQSLRMVRDQFSYKKFPLNVSMVNSSEGPFLTALENSSYLEDARCFRIAFLNEVEIQKLIAEYFDDETRICEGFSSHMLFLTGGHPLLTQVLISRLMKFKRQLDIDQINYCFRQMKNSPPDICRRWMNHLKEVLQSRKELLPNFKAYLEGMTLAPSRLPSHAERPLMIGGWLSKNHLDRWGISSLFHANLGRKVLFEMGVGND